MIATLGWRVITYPKQCILSCLLTINTKHVRKRVSKVFTSDKCPCISLENILSFKGNLLLGPLPEYPRASAMIRKWEKAQDPPTLEIYLMRHPSILWKSKMAAYTLKQLGKEEEETRLSSIGRSNTH